MTDPAYAPMSQSASAPPIGKPAIAGLAVLAVFFVGFGGWAAFAPLESAAVAPGVVSVDSARMKIQHLEGGIVSEILVRDGSEVEAGDVLVRLATAQARATLDLVAGRLMTLQARESRLVAERDGADEIAFPEAVLARAMDQGAAEIIKGERDSLAVRHATLEGQTGILNQRIAQFREEIKGLRGQVASADRRIELIEDEIKDVASLVAKGLARRPRLLALERRKADLEGQRAQNTARIARAEQSISEARLRISELRTEMRDRVVAELQEVQSEILDVSERVRAAEDVMARTAIKAPIAGTVINLQVHTASGVIGPGELLMEIVPRDDALIIEARVGPDDIDVVRPGLQARVRFTAFNQRNTRTVEGEVLDVSADSLIDERTGYAYFLTKVKVTGDIDEALMGGQLYPGMQAQVMIVTGTSTFLDYLLRPMERSFERAFRET